VGQTIAGIGAYVFLVIAARVLGPGPYGALAALWFLGFLLAPGFFFPLEQELGRALAQRRTRGEGSAPLVTHTLLIGGAIAASLLVVVGVGARTLRTHLFDGHGLLVFALAVLLVGYLAEHMVRGLLAGSGQYRPYGVLLAVEATARVVAGLAVAITGVRSAAAFGLIVGTAPFVAVASVFRRARSAISPGPAVHKRETSRAVGALIVASVLAQALINAPPLVVKALATTGRSADAGAFFAAFLVARLPLFLFAAVQATLLPQLATLAAHKRHEEFTHRLRRVLIVVGSSGSCAAVGALLFGPWAMRIVFGHGFDVGAGDLALLSVASAMHMASIAVGQALIAQRGHVELAASWIVAMLAFTVVILLLPGLVLRVELALIVGETCALVGMAVFLGQAMKSAMA
jgi:O-antigen/teichoic acid export membrane protein